MTLKKIASLANVSVSTVSRALNDSFDIAPETRQEILKIAGEYGYFRKKKKVKLENRRSTRKSVAIICPEVNSIYYCRIATVLAKELRLHGSECTIYSYDFDRIVLDDIFEKCVNDAKCDALICLENIDIPIKSVDIPIITTGGCEDYCIMNTNSMEAARLAAEHLISKGMTRIGVVSENFSPRRLRFFEEALDSHGLAPVFSFISDKRFEEAGCDAANNITMPLPEAVFCTYDEIAYGFIHTLEANGIRVPEDISVISVNNIPSSAYFHGGLTTVDKDISSVAREIVNDILFHQGEFTPKKYIAPVRLIERKTVK